MRNGLLKPGNDFINRSHVPFRQIAVHIVAKPDLNSAIPEPTNSHIDFAVVDFLKLGGEVHTDYFTAGPDSCPLPSAMVGDPAMANKRRKSGVMLSRMARRLDPAEFDRPLTEAELKERARRLSLLSPHHVEDAYRQAYEACRMEGDPLPRASAVQELVATWKLLPKWRIRGPVSRG